jgi:myo-inositol-1(or 4)-monophosphatase
MQDLFKKVVAIAQVAGNLALRHQGALSQLVVEQKGRQDFVTRADREVETLIVESIKNAFPSDGILGEEGARESGASGRLWVIDPIDGTHNFIRGMPLWSVSIGVLQDGVPVAGAIYLPALGTMLSAATGEGAWCNLARLDPPGEAIDVVAFTGAGPLMVTEAHRSLTTIVREDLGGSERRIGSATAALAAVLQGQADVYIALDDQIWDICAACTILVESGRTHSLDWRAGLPDRRIPFVAGSASLVKDAWRALEKHSLAEASGPTHTRFAK